MTKLRNIYLSYVIFVAYILTAPGYLHSLIRGLLILHPLNFIAKCTVALFV